MRATYGGGFSSAVVDDSGGILRCKGVMDLAVVVVSGVVMRWC